MSDYVKQAKDFLASCNATMEIEYVGVEVPKWDTKPHCAYDCTIKTPRGTMMVHFYDSLHNTEIMQMTTKQFMERHPWYSVSKASKMLQAKKADATPNEYHILACLEKYEVGSMDDFMYEFGYEIRCVADMTKFIDTYNAVVKEYNDVRRCFTEEQIEAMQEIQ